MALGIGLGLSRAPRPFSPLDLAPALWLRSDLGITLNAGNVSAWADQSGNARHYNQVTAGAQPIYTASGGANSTPYLELGGTRYLDATTAASTYKFLHTGCSVIAVLRTSLANPNDITGILSTTATTANGVIFSAEDRGASGFNNRVGIAVQAASGTFPFFYATSSADALPAQTWKVVQWSVATTGVNVRVAGVSVLSGALAAALPTGDPATTAKIGRCPPAYTFGAAHYVSELIAYARALTVSEQARLASYLAGRYGVVA